MGLAIALSETEAHVGREGERVRLLALSNSWNEYQRSHRSLGSFDAIRPVPCGLHRYVSSGVSSCVHTAGCVMLLLCSVQCAVCRCRRLPSPALVPRRKARFRVSFEEY